MVLLSKYGDRGRDQIVTNGSEEAHYLQRREVRGILDPPSLDCLVGNLRPFWPGHEFATRQGPGARLA